MEEQIGALRADNKKKYLFALVDALACIIATKFAFSAESVTGVVIFGCLAVFLLWDAWVSLRQVERNRDQIQTMLDRDTRLRRIGE